MRGPGSAIGAAPRRDELIRKGLKISHLRLICAIRETGQMSAAAAQLAISQPAASRLAAELEAIVGLSIHTRHSRGVELTPYGERLAARAALLLQGLDDTARELTELERGNQGTVSIGSVTGPAIDLVLPVVRHARVTHPNISISLMVDTSDKLAEDLLASRLDFYIGRLLGEVDPKLFSVTEIGPEPVSLIVRAGHPLLRSSSINLEDCVAYDWVLQARGGLLRRTIESELLARQIALPSKVLSTSSLLLTLAYISQTNAIAPVASAAADFYGREDGLGGRIVTLPVDTAITVAPYSLITHAERPLSPASRVLFRLLGNSVADQRKQSSDEDPKAFTKVI